MFPSYYSAIQTNLFRSSIVTTTRVVSLQIPVGFVSLKKVANLGKSNSKGSRGRGPTTHAVNRSLRFDSPVGGDGLSNSHNRGHMSQQRSSESARQMPNRSYEEDYAPLGATLTSTSKRKTRIDLGSQQMREHVESSQLNNFETTPSRGNYFEHEEGTRKLDISEDSPTIEPFKPFDICFSRRNYVAPNPLSPEEEKGKQILKEPNLPVTRRRSVLRPGMVLLKRYMNIRDQIRIVKTCQKLGKGPGGFYQPGFKSGAKLRLQMMCLGLSWDAETREYEKLRSFDGCEPPAIPDQFTRLVQRAIRDAHALIKKDFRVNNVEDILPAMSPDVCIVNFYKTSGRLGLHQDRDETEYSLRIGLPVVSLSVGDSAEFLYGDERDVDKAEKVVLESGDVLIFGGDSRHIFHGVSSIIPNSAPVALIGRTNLRPGRLNLTFRKY